MNIRTVAIIALAGAALTLVGCPAVDPADDYRNAPETYVSLKQLVAEHNANAAKVPRLWARAKIMVDLPGLPPIGSTSPLAETNGLLFLSKTADPTRPSKKWLSGFDGCRRHSSTWRPRPVVGIRYSAVRCSEIMRCICGLAASPSLRLRPKNVRHPGSPRATENRLWMNDFHQLTSI